MRDVFRELPFQDRHGRHQEQGAVLAVNFQASPGFNERRKREAELGAEMAQRARTHGVKGIFHSTNFRTTGSTWNTSTRLKVLSRNISPEDAFVICAAPECSPPGRRWSPQSTVPTSAWKASRKETRDPPPDGTTKYSRPLPGAARMYPETDVPPTLITEEKAAEIRASIPEFPEQIEKRLVKQ